MSEPRWKAWERQACRDMGAQRRPSIGPDGYARGSDDDGTAWAHIEAKYLERYGLRRSWVEKAREAAKAEGRPWVIAMKEHHDRAGLFVCSWLTGVQLVHDAGRIPPTRTQRLQAAIDPFSTVDRDEQIAGVERMIDKP